MGNQLKQFRGNWESEVPTGSSISLEEIDHFDARGKRRVYGRGDMYSRLTLNVDVWRSGSGQLFVRFWTGAQDYDWCSYEILGLSDSESLTTRDFNDDWIPKCLREAYDDWVTDCLDGYNSC